MAPPVMGHVQFKAHLGVGGDCSKLSLVGSLQELGEWDLHKGLVLERVQPEEGAGSQVPTWLSKSISISSASFPFSYRFVANGHRQSPTTRPLMWETTERTVSEAPADGVVVAEVVFSEDTCDSGWVTAVGMGALQLRIGQPPGSRQPLVELAAGVGGGEAYEVALYEAKAGDPAVPQGKPLARLPAGHGHGGADEGVLAEQNVTFVMNAPSIQALAFRVDVTARAGGRLLARCFIAAESLAPLEGTMTASLQTPDLQLAGWFRASYLVVTAADWPGNTLGNLQRRRWTPGGAGTLDIGHRGAGASGKAGRGVRENTLLSFEKAAANHSDFIEFDVHITGDAEVIVHHDFDVKLHMGSETLALGIPSLTYAQLASPEVTHLMVSKGSRPAGAAMGAQRERAQRSLRRNLSSAEDIFFGARPKAYLATSPREGGPPASPPDTHWRLSDRIATLREAFRRLPSWLGFNIELKYPTDAQRAVLTSRWYTRNYFCDTILKVVLEEAGGRQIIFSTFDPDCATLMSLKQPRWPVFFLTCAGTKAYDDPRMNSLPAALAFARSSRLQGVVAEASGVLANLQPVVAQFHAAGLFLFTWGEANNALDAYRAQRAAGVDAIILDDVARVTRANGKEGSLFNRQLAPPATPADVEPLPALSRTSTGIPDTLARTSLSPSLALSLSPSLALSLSPLALSPEPSPRVLAVVAEPGGWETPDRPPLPAAVNIPTASRT